MKSLPLFASVCAAAFSLTVPALAQQTGAPETPVRTDLADLVVTATRAPIRLDQVGQSLTVLDERAIRASQSVGITELLTQTPGVTYSRNGGVGKSTSINIRGAESDQTVVLIDGVKLNDPSATGGGYSASNLLSGDIARIEVLRGAQSTLWGSQAIGGVVNIITRAPTAPLEANLEAEGGSFDTAYVRGGFGGRAADKVTWRLGGGYYTSAGVSAYAPGTEADGYRNVGLNGRILVDFTPNLSLEQRLVYSDGRNEYDNTNADADNLGDTKEQISYTGLNLAVGRLKNRLAFAWTETERLNYNPTLPVTSPGTPLVNFRARGVNRRWEYQGDYAFTDAWTLVFGAEREKSSMRTASPSRANPNPVPVQAQVRIDGLYAQLQGEVLPGLTLTGGVRRDDHQTFGIHTLGQAALAYSIMNGRTVLRASYGEGFKAPSLYQLYSEYGNLALQPEEAHSWDAGVEHHILPSLAVSAAYFERDTTNQIEFVSCSAATAGNPLCVAPRTAFYNNVGKVHASGYELGAGWSWKALNLSANYTEIKAINRTPGSANLGKFLARRPQHTANATASYTWPIKLTTAVSVRYVSDSYNNAANSQLLKAYTLVDLRAAYPIGDHAELFAR
ncbi:MAG: TonB-dependent receptor, partial [Caulobacteraceae bacterium]